MVNLKNIVKLSLLIFIISYLSVSAYAISYKYDSNGRLIEVTYKSGQKVYYTYDAGGNILKVDVSSQVDIKPIDSKEIAEGENLQFKIELTSLVNDVVFSSDNLPTGAELNSTTGEFNWTPTFDQSGEYNLIFKVTSNSNIDTEDVKVVVSNVNRPPVADAGEDRVVEATSINGAEVVLDAINSYDPDFVNENELIEGDRIISYLWEGTFGSIENKEAILHLPLGDHKISLTVSDGIMESKDEINLSVKDTTPPVLTIPDDINVEATGKLTNIDIGEATATDIFAVNVSNNDSEEFSLGTTEVKWTATDENGNETTALQKINVRDTTAPVLELPSDITVEAAGTLTTVDINGVCAHDLVDNDVEINSDVPEGYPLGETIVTFTATDDSGNSAFGTVKVTVIDSTEPLISISDVDDGQSYTDSVSPIISIIDNGVGIKESEITLDGNEYTSCTKIDEKGNHTLYVKAIDNYDRESSVTIAFRIYKTTCIELTTNTIEYSDELNIEALLKSDDIGLDSKNLSFNIDGVEIKNILTDENGEVLLNDPALYKAGQHTITVSFQQDDENFYRQCDKNSEFNVIAEKTTIKYTGGIPLLYADEVLLSANVAEENDGFAGVLTNAVVEFKVAKIDINGTETEIYCKTVNSDISGNASLKLPLEVGLYKVMVSVVSNDYYSASTDTKIVPVYDSNTGKVDGGGWFMFENEKVNIAVNANYKENKANGNVEMNFHNNKDKFQSKEINWILVSKNTAEIYGIGEIKQNNITKSCTFKMQICDNGKDDLVTVYIWEGTNTDDPPLYKIQGVILKGGNMKVN